MESNVENIIIAEGRSESIEYVTAYVFEEEKIRMHRVIPLKGRFI